MCFYSFFSTLRCRMLCCYSLATTMIVVVVVCNIEFSYHITHIINEIRNIILLWIITSYPDLLFEFLLVTIRFNQFIKHIFFQLQSSSIDKELQNIKKRWKIHLSTKKKRLSQRGGHLSKFDIHVKSMTIWTSFHKGRRQVLFYI